jgi:hypothetical protein
VTVAEIVLEMLERLPIRYPRVSAGVRKEIRRAKRQLQKE